MPSALPSAVPAADPPGFGNFWEAWPSTARKVDRKKCAAKWRTAKLAQHLPTILEHVAALKLTRQWIEGYEPAPLKWLNGERWRDGLPPPPDGERSTKDPPKTSNPLHADRTFI